MRSIVGSGFVGAVVVAAGCNAVLGIQLPSGGAGGDGGIGADAESDASPEIGEAGAMHAPDGGGARSPDGAVIPLPDGSPSGLPDSAPDALETENEAAATEAGPPVEDAGADAPMGDASTCGGSTDRSSDPDNCGRCGHGCGGAACFGGECTPFIVTGDEDYSTTLAIDATGIYWGSDAYNELRQCPASGCAAAPTVVTQGQGIPWGIALAAGTVFWNTQTTTSSTIFSTPEAKLGPAGTPFLTVPAAISLLTADSADVIWTQYLSGAWTTYDCPVGGCEAGAPILADVVNDMRSDGTNLVWASNYTQLKTCLKASCVQQAIVPSGLIDARHVAVYDGVAYVSDTGGNLGTGSITSCPVHSQSCPAANFASSLPAPTFLAVDASGVYWAASEGADASDTNGAVYMCPLSGCPSSGPIPIATGQASVASVTLYGNLVYWLSGSYGNLIMAVAKP
jgi:hypothetical protein